MKIEFEVDIPGFEFVRFGQPKQGELYVTNDGWATYLRRAGYIGEFLNRNPINISRASADLSRLSIIIRKERVARLEPKASDINTKCEFSKDNETWQEGYYMGTLNHGHNIHMFRKDWLEVEATTAKYFRKFENE